MTASTLFTTEQVLGETIVKVNFPVTIKDIDVKTIHSESSELPLGVAMSLQPEIIQALQQTLGSNITENGNYESRADALKGLTSGWKAHEPFTYLAHRNGASAGDYDANSLYNTSQDVVVKNINAAINNAVKTHNEKVKNTLEKCIVDLNIQDLDAQLDKKTVEKVASLNDESVAIQKQIAALQEQDRQLNREAYNIQREDITAKFREQAGELGNAIIDELAQLPAN
jgi:hypothetical protein